jgi:DNA-directed RNA polymerase subunit beta'
VFVLGAKELENFQNVHEAHMRFETGHVDLQAACKVRINGKLLQETSVGRAILS